MRSKDQLAIIGFLELNKLATPLQLERHFAWSNKHAHAILGRLKRLGIIKNIGKPSHPQYRLVQRWQAKIKQPKPRIEPPRVPAVTEVCRANWQGYHIHKIFGSTRA
nr:hypothetical protein [uncultured Enterobacter sp.]